LAVLEILRLHMSSISSKVRVIGFLPFYVALMVGSCFCKSSQFVFKEEKCQKIRLIIYFKFMEAFGCRSEDVFNCVECFLFS
jgi:hypothetical protein